MGALLSKSKVHSDDYEQILSNLDNEIQKKEIQLTEIRLKDRRVATLWFIYSTFLWIVYIVYYLHAVKDKYSSTAFTVSPIILGPIIIFYVRKGVKWMYNKRVCSIEQKLVALRKNQELKVEELKKKTAYYSTKSLLERYDPSSPQKKELDEQNKSKREEEEKKKKAQQHQHQQQVMMASHGQALTQNPIIPITPPKQQWFDKVLDVLVGEVGPETKYALVCSRCFAHNGLVLPQEVESIEYICPKCNMFHPSRKSRMMHPDGPVLPTLSPVSPQEDNPDQKTDLMENQVVHVLDSAEGSTALIDQDQLRHRNVAADSD